MISHARHFSFTFTAALVVASAVACSGTTSSTLPGSPQTPAQRSQARPAAKGPRSIEYFNGITGGSTPRGISVGRRGMWFTQPGSNQIGVINAQGVVTELTAPTNGVNNIVQGSDGNMWFTQGGADAVGRDNA